MFTGSFHQLSDSQQLALAAFEAHSQSAFNFVDGFVKDGAERREAFRAMRAAERKVEQAIVDADPKYCTQIGDIVDAASTAVLPVIDGWSDELGQVFDEFHENACNAFQGLKTPEPHRIPLTSQRWFEDSDYRVAYTTNLFKTLIGICITEYNQTYTENVPSEVKRLLERGLQEALVGLATHSDFSAFKETFRPVVLQIADQRFQPFVNRMVEYLDIVDLETALYEDRGRFPDHWNLGFRAQFTERYLVGGAKLWMEQQLASNGIVTYSDVNNVDSAIARAVQDSHRETRVALARRFSGEIGQVKKGERKELQAHFLNFGRNFVCNPYPAIQVPEVLERSDLRDLVGTGYARYVGRRRAEEDIHLDERDHDELRDLFSTIRHVMGITKDPDFVQRFFAHQVRLHTNEELGAFWNLLADRSEALAVPERLKNYADHGRGVLNPVVGN